MNVKEIDKTSGCIDLTISDDEVGLFFTPPRKKFRIIGSPINIKSTDSWNNDFSHSYSPLSVIIGDSTSEILSNPFTSPHYSIKQLVHQVQNFLGADKSTQPPYIHLKNHLLCPFCRIRVTDTTKQYIICQCGAKFKSGLDCIQLSNS